MTGHGAFPHMRLPQSAGPEFDVVIPLYNKGRFLTRCLDSILAQSVQPKSVIIVDDGSTDASAEIAATHLLRPMVLVTDRVGPGRARNRGVEASKADWIAFLDADDHWLPDHLSVLTEIITEGPTVVAAATRSGSGARQKRISLPWRGRRRSRYGSYWQLATERGSLFWPFSMSSFAVRQQLFIASEGFRDLRMHEDIEFWMRISAQGALGYRSKVTAVYDKSASEQAKGYQPVEGGEHSLDAYLQTEPARLTLATRDALRTPSNRLPLEQYLDRILIRRWRALIALGEQRSALRAARRFFHPRHPRALFFMVGMATSLVLRRPIMAVLRQRVVNQQITSPFLPHAHAGNSK